MEQNVQGSKYSEYTEYEILFTDIYSFRLYNSLIRRGFHAICLVGATDEDAFDIVHSFPLASKQIHSISLRSSGISDRGLEALLDHLQVLIFINIQLFHLIFYK